MNRGFWVKVIQTQTQLALQDFNTERGWLTTVQAPKHHRPLYLPRKKSFDGSLYCNDSLSYNYLTWRTVVQPCRILHSVEVLGRQCLATCWGDHHWQYHHHHRHGRPLRRIGRIICFPCSLPPTPPHVCGFCPLVIPPTNSRPVEVRTNDFVYVEMVVWNVIGLDVRTIPVIKVGSVWHACHNPPVSLNPKLNNAWDDYLEFSNKVIYNNITIIQE